MQKDMEGKLSNSKMKDEVFAIKPSQTTCSNVWSKLDNIPELD